MKNNSMIYVLILVALLLVSCSAPVNVVLSYDFVLKSPEPQNIEQPLVYTDSLFKFQFSPLTNGIYFTISNLTDKPAVLLWDYTYFITPNNNSYNALHQDLIEANNQTMEKAKYQSILPPHSDFSRLTTPTNNLSVFQIDFYSRYTHWLENTVYMQTRLSNLEYTQAGSFYPVHRKIMKKDKEAYFNEISNLVKSKNVMGIGYRILIDDKPYDYRFMFRVSYIRAHTYLHDYISQSGEKKFQQENHYVTDDSLNIWYEKVDYDWQPAFKD